MSESTNKLAAAEIYDEANKVVHIYSLTLR